MAYNFNTFSTIFLISNIIALPLVEVITAFGIINIIVGFIYINLAKIIAVFTNILLQLLILVTKLSSEIPYSNLIIKTPNPVFIIVYYILILFIPVFFFMKQHRLHILKHIPKKKLLIISAVIIFTLSAVNITYYSIPGDLKIDFIDVRSAVMQL